MSELVTVQMDMGEVGALVGRYAGTALAARIADGVRLGMDRANLSIVGRAQRDRLTGKGPFPVPEHRLGVRSGQLRRSMRATKAVVVDVTTFAVESRAGSRVKYFGAHEFGFKGRVSVRPHTRKSKSGGKATNVRGHTRQMDMPERKPLRTTYEDDKSRQVFQREIGKAVQAQLETLT